MYFSNFNRKQSQKITLLNQQKIKLLIDLSISVLTRTKLFPTKAIRFRITMIKIYVYPGNVLVSPKNQTKYTVYTYNEGDRT